MVRDVKRLGKSYGSYTLFMGMWNYWAELNEECFFEEEEIVASISGTEGKRFKILPHVHISVAWIFRNFPPEQLNWKSINESPDITQ
jgi:hypothetical protein